MAPMLALQALRLAALAQLSLRGGAAEEQWHATDLQSLGGLQFACPQKSDCGLAGAAKAADDISEDGVATAHEQVRRGNQVWSAFQSLLPDGSALDMFGEEDPVWQFQAAAQKVAHRASETAQVLGSGLSIGAKVAASHAFTTAKQVGCRFSTGAQVAASRAADTAELIGESVATAYAAAGSVTEMVTVACKEAATIAPEVLHVAVGAAEHLSVRASRVAPRVMQGAVGVAGEVAKGAAKAVPHATKAAAVVAGEVGKRVSNVQQSAAQQFSRATATSDVERKPRSPRRLDEGSAEQELEEEYVQIIDLDEVSCNVSEQTTSIVQQSAAQQFNRATVASDVERKLLSPRRLDEGREEQELEAEYIQFIDLDEVPRNVSEQQTSHLRPASEHEGHAVEGEKVDEPNVEARDFAVSARDDSAVEVAGKEEVARLAAEAVARVFKHSNCALYEGCSHLEGFCCPTPDGLMLGCCASARLSQEHAGK